LGFGSYSKKRIPVAVASDLIHCFVRLTTQTDKNYKDREQLQLLSKVDEPALFAVQLLHRWTVRTVVQSSFPMKPVKIFQVNVAGYVNPLQHMRGPNENVNRDGTCQGERKYPSIRSFTRMQISRTHTCRCVF
jgi:hypothetical protein